jgi:hypothetical protein
MRQLNSETWYRAAVAADASASEERLRLVRCRWVQARQRYLALYKAMPCNAAILARARRTLCELEEQKAILEDPLIF